MVPATPAIGGRGEAAHLRAVPDGASERGVTRDRLRFRDPSELHVYEALRRVQDQLDTFDTLGIASSVRLRIRGHTFEIDLLVTYRGRSGAIEVDGASHVGKWASDRSRDELIEDCGIRVYRIDAADTADRVVLDEHVRRFLKRLSRAAPEASHV